jgi:hypothetical protein
MRDGMILKHELARQRGIGVERHRSGLIEFLVATSSCRTLFIIVRNWEAVISKKV